MSVRAARLTPPGTGAIATIAVVGESAWSITNSLFRARGNSITDPPKVGSVLLGHFGEPPGDEVVITVRPDVADWYEVHCHGGPQVVDWLLEQLAERGAQVVSWTELESIVSPESFQAEASIELTRALTLRTANILLDQYRGALAGTIRSIIQHFDSHQPDAARLALERLASLCGVGKHLTKPWRVAVCGPPNAGKSSLVNALAGYQRAVVTPIPGTTRDVVSTLLAFNGWPVELLDTAGIRTAGDEIEDIGIRLGLNAARDADLVLWVTEPRKWEPAPFELDRPLFVLNKSDLIKDRGAEDPPPATQNEFIELSATYGDGLEKLIAEMVKRLIPHPPQPGEGVPFNDRLADAILAARQLWHAGDLLAARQTLATLLSPADSA